MDTGISFQGAFLIKQPSVKIRQSIIKKLGSKNQIFENFNQDGDALYVIKDYRDSGVADFIKKHSLKFEYYPEINTKTRLDPQLYEEARTKLKEGTLKVIKTTEELTNYLASLVKPARAIKPAKAKENLVTKTMFAIGFKPENYKLKNKNGYTTVLDKTGRIAARISPMARYGINYAYIIPKSTDASPIRYALRDGEIIFQYTTPSGAKQFQKNFKEAVEYNTVV